MIIGVPKEIKDNENRVAAIPATVQALVSRGHSVLVQKGAGDGSGIPDKAFESAGAKIVTTARQVFKSAELILKVKEPLPPEYPVLRPGQIMGIPPTGRAATVMGIAIYRVMDSQIAEAWVAWDVLGLMRQLGQSSSAEDV